MSTFYGTPTGQPTTQYQANPYNQQQYQPQPQTQQPQEQQNAAAPQPQPQQTNAPTANVWNPATVLTAAATGANFSDQDKMDIVASALKYSLDKGATHFIPGLGRFMTYLRVYFAVDNRYVLKKIQRVSFPFIFKHWKRVKLDQSQQQQQQQQANAQAIPEYALPIHDENAPDLYLPFMSLITYVLLCALVYGASGQFTPEVIPDVSTKCLLTQLLEVLMIRFGFYLMQVPIAFLDLFALTGYKYLGLSVNMLIGMGFGHKVYYGALLYYACAAAYFLLKCMSNAVPKEVAKTGPKREFVVLGCAASQIVTMWFLSQTKYLS